MRPILAGVLMASVTVATLGSWSPTASATALDGPAIHYVGNFDGGNPKSEILRYFPDAHSWRIGTLDRTGNRMIWDYAGNTKFLGNLAGEKLFWTGDFEGKGKQQELFYYKGDHNWWLGTYNGGELEWKLVGNTAGFGDLMAGNHQLYVGDFQGTGKTELLMYDRRNGDWRLGYWSVWSSGVDWYYAGNTAGFGNLMDGTHKVFTGNFGGTNRTELLMYYAGDGNWFRATWDGSQLSWSNAGNTTGFGNLLDGTKPMYTGKFSGMSGPDELLFQYGGDGNWWHGVLTAGVLTWNYAGTHDWKLADGTRAVYTGNFRGQNHTNLLMYDKNQNNWSLASYDGTAARVNWKPVTANAAFNNLYDGNHEISIGNFKTPDKTNVLFHHKLDDHWLLGEVDESGTAFTWTRVDSPDQHRADWMAYMAADIGHTPLRKLVLPGTHDSGAIKPVFSWADAQSKSIYDQLRYGIRYFDLRVHETTTTPTYYFLAHGPIAYQKFLNVLDEIQSFVNQYPKEIIILHMGEFQGGRDGVFDHYTLMNELTNRFGSKLVPKNSAGLANLTPDTIWSAGQQVIAVYAHSAAATWPKLWSHGDNFYAPYDQVCTFTELVSTRGGYVNTAKTITDKLFSFGLPITPTQEPARWGDCPGSLEYYANKFNPPALDYLRANWGSDVNIVSLDFFENVDFVTSLIELNRKGLSSVPMGWSGYLTAGASQQHVIRVGSNETINLTLSFPPGADFKLYLYDPAGGQPGGSAARTGNSETISYAGPAGRYTVKVVAAWWSAGDWTLTGTVTR